MVKATRADSVMPSIASKAKIPNKAMATGTAGTPPTSVPAYSTAVLALMQAVARYERKVMHAAAEALNFVVVFKSAL